MFKYPLGFISVLVVTQKRHNIRMLKSLEDVNFSVLVLGVVRHNL